MTSQLPEVVRALLSPGIYPHPTSRIELIQTQISFVLLTGQYVYKLKKPLNLGYLDYTTLEKRRFFCQQEVELNRRLCPETYLGVVPITRRESGLALSGEGEVIDYAVKMRYLPRERMLNILLDRDRVTADMVEQVARKLVDFHSKAASNSVISAFGSLEAIRLNANENFSQTEKFFGRTLTPVQFRRIQEFTFLTLDLKAAIFRQRVENGRVRDCHGDLHSQNICFTNGICIYDCIEFNDRFRYIDVASEIAFLAMDLDHYGRADLSRVFSSTYIRLSQDSQIKEVLKFYQCYRAYVRGKVASFKIDDPYISGVERKQTQEDARRYFDLADSYSRSRPVLFITAGLVGSGKSTLARALARRWSLTVVSSDLVRKQLAGIPATKHRFEEMETGIYSAEFTRRTYDQLYAQAREILKQGDSVILDATFLKTEERQKARKLAAEIGADFVVLECRLDEANTRQRLAERLKHTAVSDGRWEIYELQKKNFDPVAEIPPDRHFILDTSKPLFDQLTSVLDNI